MADRTSTAGVITDSGPAASGVAAVSNPNEPDPLIGRLVNGRFKIVSVIARGGMGKVYKAEQAPLGRVCALKVLSPKYQGDRDPEFNKRFFLEAATAAKLTHPNTVTVFDYGQDGDDLYFIAMEFIEGRTLHRLLRDHGPMGEDRVAVICSQICRSLREAHGLGVVHRDLKPGNILVSDRGDEHDVVKVLDFGLVKDLSNDSEDLTQAGLFMGSPKYMAPEQILGGEITACTDIYSLGVMMFEMLTGKVPFDRGVSVKTLMAHVNDPLPAMRTVNPSLRASQAMENIVTRCLEKDAARRFASMKDVLLALKRIGNDDQSITETSEALPRTRVDSNMPPSIPSGAISGPISGEPSQPMARLTASPSISDTLGSVPGTLSEAAPPRSRAPVLAGVIAALAVVAVGAVVALGRGNEAADPHLSTSPSGTVAPSPSSSTDVVAPPPTATAVTPTIRQVRVESDPPGATVSEGDTQLCTSTPCELTWKDDAARAEHKLQVVKKGYKTTKLTVGTTEEKTLAKLEVIPVTVAPPPPPPPPPAPGRPLYKKDF